MVTNMFLKVLVLLAAVLTVVAQAQFKTCAESSVCNYLRNKEPTPNEFQLLTAFGVASTNNSITWNVLKNTETVLQFTISFLFDDTIRFQITELYDNRYYLDTALNGPPIPENVPFYWENHNAQNITMVWGGDHALIVHSDPFTIEVYQHNDLVAIFNADGRLTYDHEGVSREVGFDITFPLATVAYGLPLHADNLVLRQTEIGGEDPYRLHNVGILNYDINSTKALAGAVPVLFAHGVSHTSGVFFHNAYETWVDVDYSRGNLAVHYMVADGIFDAFVFVGPSPDDIYRQYTTLTGVTPLPNIWSLGYHHGAISGESAADLLALVSSFDEYEIPLESIFIAGQNASFSWDLDLFPSPFEFQLALANNNKKVVLAVNPFIQFNFSDALFETAVANEYLILEPTRLPYAGNTYLGRSAWWDFTNYFADRYFVDRFDPINFPTATRTVAGFWNVFNEPFAMDTEDNILPLELVHQSGFSHKDVHNIYSHMMNQATYFGQIERYLGEVRPFVLADAFFAGSQRYVAIYTGNSVGDWDHLAISYRMCLSASIAGFPFCGTNVGGVIDLASEELLVRWYQAAIWLPLFRSESREPERKPSEWSEETRGYIKQAIDLRYSLIDHIYTLFFEHERFRNPVVKPLFYQYPRNANLFYIDNGFILGDEILVYPISQPNQTAHVVYLAPGDVWYDADTPLLYNGYGFTLVDVYPDRIPVFYRGGGIVARRNGFPRNTEDMRVDSFDIYVFLDTNLQARGRILFDDGSSYGYRRNEYTYLSFTFQDDELHYELIDEDAFYPDEPLITRQVYVFRPPSSMKTTEGEAPISITPEVYDTTVDGIPFKDMNINANKKQSIRFR